MQQLTFFFQKYKYFLFFLLLSFISIALTINNNAFHKSKFISSANTVSGGIYKKTSELSDYFNLEERNKQLVIENTKLKNKLENILILLDSTIHEKIIDSLYNQEYTYTNAKIIKNEYIKQNNFILIDKGSNDSIYPEMAVINSKGIIGITDQVSPKYARVQSILNTNSKINARLKNSFHFGTLKWNGKDYNTVQLTDIPRQAKVKVGDTIITGGKSTIFPEGIMIGTVKEINHLNTVSQINIQLFNDMSNLGFVYVYKDLNKLEINTLEQKGNE